ncbi:hypothetical protein KP509_04G027800 [Ceratopteris richardii]|uniref:Uncharacterized protein n=1 Tax=Ceratopteris richardii TaxID=49495 RepID=A0A8T2UVE5_CERRI|nr:hypothetical protein KP509_04G027800 [Ceratopteris richardii]
MAMTTTYQILPQPLESLTVFMSRLRQILPWRRSWRLEMHEYLQIFLSFMEHFSGLCHPFMFFHTFSIDRNNTTLSSWLGAGLHGGLHPTICPIPRVWGQHTYIHDYFIVT